MFGKLGLRVIQTVNTHPSSKHSASHIDMVETDTCYLCGYCSNGKSTYMNMAIGVTGKDVSNILNGPARDDNALVTISPTTRLIVGRELSTNSQVQRSSLSRFKALTTGNPIATVTSIERCYLQWGVKLQRLNDIPRFVGRDNAIDSRLIIRFRYVRPSTRLLRWRQDKDLTSYSVDELVNDGYKDFGVGWVHATHLNVTGTWVPIRSSWWFKVWVPKHWSSVEIRIRCLIAETSDDVDIFYENSQILDSSTKN